MKKSILNFSKKVVLGIAATAMFFTSCIKEEINGTNANGSEIATVFLRSYHYYGPNGNVNYLDVVSDFSKAPDNSKMVELGFNSFVLSHNEHPYTVNRDAKTITKWKVNKQDLSVSVEGLLSFASTGVNSTAVAFVSAEQGFISDLGEGVIVEFSPSSMEIVKTHNVTPVTTSTNFGFWTEPNVYNGKLIFPIQWNTRGCCAYDMDLKATVGIFDPSTGTLTYDTDNRAIGLNGKIFYDGNDAYLVPANSQNAWIKPFYDDLPDGLPNPHVILKLNVDGTIDDNFVRDINEVLPEASVDRGASFINQGKFVYTLAKDPVTGPWSDRFSNRSSLTMHVTSYDLNSRETKPFTSFSNYNGVFPANSIDGVNYFRANFIANGTWDFIWLRQDGPESYTEVFKVVDGSINGVFKLW